MKTAFVFPGQGSQYVGMGRALAEAYPVARRTLAEADEALGRPLTRLVFEGPEDELTVTWNTQPAILAVSVACLRVLREATDLVPVAAAGHSLGEYSALVAAGALSFADAVKVVEQRGRFMQEAVPLGTGTMAAVLGLDADRLDRICRECSTDQAVVELANDNCPGQLVISGHVAAVEAACEAAKKAGARRAVTLAVSAPFHSSLMGPAGERLAEVLAGVDTNDPSLPVVANVDARLYEGADSVSDKLVRQVSSPVRWQDGVKVLGSLGVQRLVEVGPGKVLSGLARRIDRGLAVVNVDDPAGVAALAEA